MAIIVNADDFGLSHEVNMAICDAFSKGFIQRTTLMTNMPFAREAMELAKENGFADRVGVHLNLTSGRPLREEMAKDRLMCNDDGEFTAEFAKHLKTRFFLPKETCKDVESEIRAQLDEYKNLGGTLWHIDSHHHVHTDPSVWKVAVKVFRNYPVSGVRLGRNMYRGGNPLLRIYKKIYNSSVLRFCKTKCDYFGSSEDYADYIGGDSGFALQFPTENNIEIMVHPVYDQEGNLRDAAHGTLIELKKFV